MKPEELSHLLSAASNALSAAAHLIMVRKEYSQETDALLKHGVALASFAVEMRNK